MPRRVSCPWFVGRARELAAVTAALDTAAGGGTATVLIGGEAGIGKSRLVAEVAGRAAAAGFAVFTGNCLDLVEGGAPYAPVHEIVAAIAASLDPGARREVLGPDDGSSPAAVLPGALGRLTARGPVAVVVEDLHWADRSTRDLVAYLSAGPRVPGLLVVATYRRDDLAGGHPLRAMLAELERADRVEHLRLEPFGPADLAEQLQGILGARPGPELTREVVARSDGNPFLAEELAATAGTGPLSDGVRDLLLARVDRVGGDAQVVLRAAAVGGRRVRHATLAAVCPVEEPALSAALREAVTHHLIVADDDHYAFRHALLHEAVVADLLPGERRDLHAAYAAAIEREPALVGLGASGALVHHWAEAGRPGAALVAAVEAGLSAESAFALPEAQRYFEWGLRLWDDLGGPDAAIDVPLGYEELLQRAAENASRAGDLERAADLVSRALTAVDPASDPARAALLYERRGWCLLQAGRTDHALGAYRHAVALVPSSPPSVARARVLAASADAMERAGDLVAARDQARAAIAAAIAAGSPADEGHARHTLGAALAALGDPAGLEELDRALDLAEGGGDLTDAVGIHLHLWRQLAPLGRAGEVVDRARTGAAVARAGGRDVLAGVLDGIAAGYCHLLGRWEEVDAWLATPIDGLPGVVQLVVGGSLDVDRGDLDRAGDRLEAARGLTAGLHDGRIDGLLFRALAERALWRGRADDALAIVADGLDRTGDLELAARLALVGLRALDDEAPAVALVERLRRLDDEARTRNLAEGAEIRVAAATGEAELGRLAGASDPCAWERAHAGWSALGFPVPALYARWRQAEAVLAAQGSREVAGDLLREAWTSAQDLGAAPWTAAIERAARRARLGVGAPAAGDETAGDERPFGLTVREAEVLALLGRGWTNRQIAGELFISEKTARVHVSHILAKLAVATRAQAVDVAHRQGLLRIAP